MAGMTGSNPPNPNTSITLPPEILDKIFEQIPMDNQGKWYLRACALVATWWMGPSQRRLFSSIWINETNHQGWMDSVVYSGSKPRLLEYIQSLTHSRGMDIVGKYQMRDLSQDSGEYLSAVRNLRCLTFSDIRFEQIGEEGFRTCFSAFRETLGYLSLEAITTSFGAFVTLVVYFPNIAYLQLHLVELEPDEEPIPSLSRPLRGMVHVHYNGLRCLDFIKRFAKLDLEYEELVIESFLPMRGKFLEGALRISASTVKFLKLFAQYKTKIAVEISDFQQLRELELTVGWENPCHKPLLSSITSTELRKIILLASYMDGLGGYPPEVEMWSSIDEQLSTLVDRLRTTGYRHTLEAELRLMDIGGDPGEHDFAKILPRFREKGVVIVIDVDNGDCVHHSTARKA